MSIFRHFFSAPSTDELNKDLNTGKRQQNNGRRRRRGCETKKRSTQETKTSNVDDLAVDRLSVNSSSSTTYDQDTEDDIETCSHSLDDDDDNDTNSTSAISSAEYQQNNHEEEDEDDEDDDDDDDDADQANQHLAAASKHDGALLPEELCELPTFLNTKNCDKNLIDETRRLLKKKFNKRPDSFHPIDYERMLVDDWTVSRFLLRCRLQPKRSAKLMEQCGKFRREYRMGVSQLSDFPIEFHRAGGLFRYAPDRVGNQTLFMRVKMHRRVPELSQIMREFILCCLEECDKANGGRGTAVVFDLTNCGLQNADPGFLFWLVYSFRNYCPKGLSYIIIYNLPWILNATAKLAISWMSSTNRKRLRFVSGDGIKDFIAPENLPDYLGGTCSINYRKVPEGSRLAEDTAEKWNLTREQSRKIREMYEKFLNDVDEDIKLMPEKTIDKKTNDDNDESTTTKGVITSGMVAS